MRILKTCALTALLTVIVLGASAQATIPLNEPDYNRVKMFADLPEKFAVDFTALTQLLSLEVGATVNTTLGANFLFEGTVMSVNKSADVQSVVIRSTNRPGAGLTFTRVSLGNGTYKYLGRVLSMRHGDALELVKIEDLYYFQKKGFYDTISE